MLAPTEGVETPVPDETTGAPAAETPVPDETVAAVRAVRAGIYNEPVPVEAPTSRDEVARTLDFIGVDTTVDSDDADTEHDVYPCISCWMRMRQQPPFQIRSLQCAMCLETLHSGNYAYMLVLNNLRTREGKEAMQFSNMHPAGKGM